MSENEDVRRMLFRFKMGDLCYIWLSVAYITNSHGRAKPLHHRHHRSVSRPCSINASISSSVSGLAPQLGQCRSCADCLCRKKCEEKCYHLVSAERKSQIMCYSRVLTADGSTLAFRVRGEFIVFQIEPCIPSVLS